MAVFFVRIFFIIAIAALSVVAGMWLGLTAVDGFKLEPRAGLIHVQLCPPVTLHAKLIKGGD